VQVGPGGAAGGAHLAQPRAGFDQLTLAHGQHAQVAVEAEHPQPVVEDHGAAGEEQRGGQRHPAAPGGAHGRARARAEVDPGVR
jgi:hypothetical protein